MLKHNVYNISLARSFLDALASKILNYVDDNLLALCDITIFLPNRRACRSLAEAFLRLSAGKVILLPKILSLGDIDDDDLTLLSTKEIEIPPAINELEKKLILSKLIKAKFEAKDNPISYDTALSLASELSKLLNEVINEGADLDKINDLIPQEFAEHWQETIDFLSIITTYWQPILEEKGCIESAERRQRLIDEQINYWHHNPPQNTVIMAGFSGFQPIISQMMNTVANLDKGLVVFYGLDFLLSDDAYSHIEENHPQYGIKRFLEKLELSRFDVSELDFLDLELKNNGHIFNQSRVKLCSEIMLPAENTKDWLEADGIDDEAVSGLNVINFKDHREEALGIALMMRQALETKGKTAALVTPDRNLARSVAAELERWHITLDDSAGKPLTKTPIGIFILLTAEMVIKDFAPKELLSALKHPFSCGGISAPAFRSMVRKLEIAVLRGVCPTNGINGLKTALIRFCTEHNKSDELSSWLDELSAKAQLFYDLCQKETASFKELLKAHMEFIEELASDDQEKGYFKLWRNDDGEAAAEFISSLYEKADLLPTIRPQEYFGIISNLMSPQNVRSKYHSHNRLAILGLMEARLQRYDLMIMGSVNEEIWSTVNTDPFMNRKMRSEIGLPSPDCYLGFMAYDFAANFCAPRVVITRAGKENGSPTTCSRWLLKLSAIIDILELNDVFNANSKSSELLKYYISAIDKPEKIEAIAPPAPCPPVESRPRKLAVTGIETLMRDPYAIYAKHILKIKALDNIAKEPEAKEFGSLIHEIIADFLAGSSRSLENLLQIGRSKFDAEQYPASIKSFWWQDFLSIASWLINEENNHQGAIKKSFCEIKGGFNFAASLAPFELYAIADRINLLTDNTLEIVDYKTGTIPSKKHILAGFSPQLPLEVVIAEQGGFKELQGYLVSDVCFWELKGREKSKKISKTEVIEQAERAFEGLKALINAFDNPATPYQSRPHPTYAPKYSDYQHLARVKEWASSEDNEGESE
ncbi:MAG: double-strand break repair protein AddB [Alphaproteobacteria bacterium]